MPTPHLQAHYVFTLMSTYTGHKHDGTTLLLQNYRKINTSHDVVNEMPGLPMHRLR